jgi:uncharacterized protein YeaO (DUF488 family)
MIRVKHVYDPPAKADGLRLLVDRLWPRGLAKPKAHVDLWLKDIAPSDELRKWYGHDPAKWPEFRKRYFRELAGKRDLVEELDAKSREGTVTLLYAARDGAHNNAVALEEYLAKEAT